MDALSDANQNGASSAQPILSVRNLRVVRPGSSQPIFAPLSFDLFEGECLAVLGPSGIGKSLTLRALLGLVPESLSVEFDSYEFREQSMLDRSVRDWNSLRGATIGLIQQDTGAALDPLQRVDDAVNEAAEIHSLVQKSVDSSRGVDESLRAAGFDDPERVRHRWPHELSGGMRQRVVIASALSANPEILLADEPTTALDARVQNSVVKTLLALKDERKSLIFVSHDSRLVEQMADRVVHIQPASTSGSMRQNDIGADLSGVVRAAESTVIASQVPASSVLSVRNISKRFPTGDGIHAVSFELRPSQTLGILGESGAGKSTLARIVMGLMRPDVGEVRVDERTWVSPTQMPQRSLRALVQWVPQDALSSFARGMRARTILREALSAAAKLRGEAQPSHDEMTSRVQQLLDDVQLAESVLLQKPHTLSGGQRQRLAIARALALQPRILVCDESLSALDEDIRDEIVNMLKRLSAEKGLALVCISHDVHLIAQIADEIMVLHRGEVIENASADEVLHHPAHPFTAELLFESGYWANPNTPE